LKKYVCIPCGYIYDPNSGDPDNSIVPGTIFEDTVEPIITYEPNLSVRGYETSGSWARSTSSFPEYSSNIECLVSNTGNAVAENVNFEIRVDGKLVVTEAYESVPAQGGETYVHAVTTHYDSSHTIEVKTWCLSLSYFPILNHLL